MALKQGMLIATIGYKEMTVNNPIPWVGMPVYFKVDKKWLFVETVYGKYAQLSDGTVLSSYQSVDTASSESKFILPGQKNASSLWPPNVKYQTGLPLTKDLQSGKWLATTFVGPSGVFYLWAPKGVTLGELFPSGGKEKKRIVVNLKALNTDGRSTCAQCSGNLKKPIQFWTNMNYCPVCEG